jgi:hypothetical protein
MKAATVGWPLFPAACVIVTNLVLLAVPPKRCCGFSETSEQSARSTVIKYAFEALPEWQRTHPEATCPRRLGELNEWMNNKDIRDPWGRDYRFICTLSSQHGRSIVVWSAGPDRRFGNSDDIASDR